MTKLKKFKQKKPISTKNMVYALALIVFALAAIVISKSYAIYKLQKDYDVIKSQIGNYPQGDIKIAVLVDGKETSKFPTYEDNYKIESVECSNGVNATFDVRNWQINIADMSATSTKCTVSFNSHETNEETPLAYSKEELIALNEEYQNVAYNNLKTQLLNDTYPVGSIYMSTEDDTVEKVQNKFGGTWVKYDEGRMLMSAGSTYSVNSTGGSSTVTLSTANLPSHKHTINGLNISGSLDSTWYLRLQTDGNMIISGDVSTYWQSGFLGTTSTKSYRSFNIGNRNGSTEAIGSGTAINIQNPYTAVYMYKRTA